MGLTECPIGRGVAGVYAQRGYNALRTRSGVGEMSIDCTFGRGREISGGIDCSVYSGIDWGDWDTMGSQSRGSRDGGDRLRFFERKIRSIWDRLCLLLAEHPHEAALLVFEGLGALSDGTVLCLRWVTPLLGRTIKVSNNTLKDSLCFPTTSKRAGVSTGLGWSRIFWLRNRGVQANARTQLC